MVTPLSRNEPRALVSWCSPIYDGGCALTGYTVECRRIGDIHWRITAENCHRLSYETEPLKPGDSYLFRVRAVNVHGPSDPSPESKPFELPTAEMDDTEDSAEFENISNNLEDGKVINLSCTFYFFS